VQETDGPRFRGGVALSGGGLAGGGVQSGLGLFGVDGRIGVQINNLIGVYGQPYLGVGGGSGLFIGTVGALVMVDFTFIDHIFVGAGGGGGLVFGGVSAPVACFNGVCDSSSGGAFTAGQAHLRLGGYPVVAQGLNGIRRKGLMVGLDLAVHIVPGIGPLFQPMVGVGYEAF
jgi:hypothetical protein